MLLALKGNALVLAVGENCSDVKPLIGCDEDQGPAQPGHLQTVYLNDVDGPGVWKYPRSEYGVCNLMNAPPTIGGKAPFFISEIIEVILLVWDIIFYVLQCLVNHYVFHIFFTFLSFHGLGFFKFQTNNKKKKKKLA